MEAKRRGIECKNLYSFSALLPTQQRTAIPFWKMSTSASWYWNGPRPLWWLLFFSSVLLQYQKALQKPHVIAASTEPQNNKKLDACPLLVYYGRSATRRPQDERRCIWKTCGNPKYSNRTLSYSCWQLEKGIWTALSSSCSEFLTPHFLICFPK